MANISGRPGRILLAGILSLACLNCAAQNKGFQFGGSLGIVAETKTVQVYGPGWDPRTSKTVSPAVGLKAAYVWEKTRLTAGISYAPRRYKMKRPFNYCAFLEPGEDCPEILAHVDRYRYETIEFPVSFDIRLMHTRRFCYYVGASTVHSIYYKSVYDPYIPATDKKTHPENLKTFSSSIRGQLGITYHPNKKWMVNAQPFITITSKQKGDTILFEPAGFKETWWNSFGLVLDFLMDAGQK